MLNRILLYTSISIVFLFAGFATSLTLHWLIRPPADQLPQQAEQLSELPAMADVTSNGADDSSENTTLRSTVFLLENKLQHSQEIQAMNEGRARALISELQHYRTERDQFLQRLEARNQKLVNKIEELNTNIEEQLDKKVLSTQTIDDYELTAQLTSYLSYPHALNDVDILDAHLINTPHQSVNFVEQRFQLMLQPEDYNFTEKVYVALSSMHQKLNKENKNLTETLWVHCVELACEIQVSIEMKDAFYDYRQQWLDALSTKQATKGLAEHQYTQEDNVIYIAAMIKRLDVNN